MEFYSKNDVQKLMEIYPLLKNIGANVSVDFFNSSELIDMTHKFLNNQVKLCCFPENVNIFSSIGDSINIVDGKNSNCLQKIHYEVLKINYLICYYSKKDKFDVHLSKCWSFVERYNNICKFIDDDERKIHYENIHINYEEIKKMFVELVYMELNALSNGNKKFSNLSRNAINTAYKLNLTPRENVSFYWSLMAEIYSKYIDYGKMENCLRKSLNMYKSVLIYAKYFEHKKDYKSGVVVLWNYYYNVDRINNLNNIDEIVNLHDHLLSLCKYNANHMWKKYTNLKQYLPNCNEANIDKLGVFINNMKHYSYNNNNVFNKRKLENLEEINDDEPSSKKIKL